MSDAVEVPFEGEAREKAILLLAAAAELGLDSSVVQSQSGGFLVPAEVEKQAFHREEAPKEPAKKAAAAKKSTPKKAQE